VTEKEKGPVARAFFLAGACRFDSDNRDCYYFFAAAFFAGAFVFAFDATFFAAAFFIGAFFIGAFFFAAAIETS
jgi:hypothetical protein